MKIDGLVGHPKGTRFKRIKKKPELQSDVKKVIIAARTRDNPPWQTNALAENPYIPAEALKAESVKKPDGSRVNRLRFKETQKEVFPNREFESAKTAWEFFHEQQKQAIEASPEIMPVNPEDEHDAIIAKPKRQGVQRGTGVSQTAGRNDRRGTDSGNSQDRGNKKPNEGGPAEGGEDYSRATRDNAPSRSPERYGLEESPELSDEELLEVADQYSKTINEAIAKKRTAIFEGRIRGHP